NRRERSIIQADDRGHTAGVLLAGFLHQAPTLAHQLKRVLEVQHASRDQRGELAQAVAGHQRWRPEVAERPQSLLERLKAGDTNRQNSRLSVDRIVQLLLWAFEAEGRE